MEIGTFVFMVLAIALGVYAGRNPKTVIKFTLAAIAIGLGLFALLIELEGHGTERILPWGLFVFFLLLREPVSNYLETHKSSKLNIFIKGAVIAVILTLLAGIVILLAMAAGLIK